MRKIYTQKEMVTKHLRRFGKITSAQAWERYGVTRLADIVYKLRRDGMIITTEETKAKNRFGRSVQFATYRLKR